MRFQRFVITQPLETAYSRQALFAVELLDGVTLSRVSDGFTVTAVGLQRRPIVNSGGLFTWLREGLTMPSAVTVDPGLRPFQPVWLPGSQLVLPPAPRPITRVELAPRNDYPFPAGTTGVRGRVVETQAEPPVAVTDGTVRMTWLQDGGTWRNAPLAPSTALKGDFVLPLRLSPGDEPKLATDGSLTIRLHVLRSGSSERRTADLAIPFGRMTDAMTTPSLKLVWDDLQL